MIKNRINFSDRRMPESHTHIEQELKSYAKRKLHSIVKLIDEMEFHMNTA